MYLRKTADKRVRFKQGFFSWRVFVKLCHHLCDIVEFVADVGIKLLFESALSGGYSSNNEGLPHDYAEQGSVLEDDRIYCANLHWHMGIASVCTSDYSERAGIFRF